MNDFYFSDINNYEKIRQTTITLALLHDQSL